MSWLDDNRLLAVDDSLTHGILEINGLRFCIIPNFYPSNRVHVNINVNVGSLCETPEELGMAHVVEHCVFGTTEAYPDTESIRRTMTSLGMSYNADSNAHTDFRETVYTLEGPYELPEDVEALKDENIPMSSTTLPVIFHLLHQFLFKATFEAKMVETEKKAVLSEASMRDSVSYQIETISIKQLHDHDNMMYRRLPIGSTVLVKDFTPAQLERFYRKWYRPELMTIYVVGPIADVDGVLSLINYFFSDTSKVNTENTESILVKEPELRDPAYGYSDSSIVAPRKVSNIRVFDKKEVDRSSLDYCASCNSCFQCAPLPPLRIRPYPNPHTFIPHSERRSPMNPVIVQHPTQISSFSMSLTMKLPLNELPLSSRAQFAQNLMDNIIDVALTTRLDTIRRRQSRPAFSGAQWSFMASPEEGCTYSGFVLGSDNFQRIKKGTTLGYGGLDTNISSFSSEMARIKEECIGLGVTRAWQAAVAECVGHALSMALNGPGRSETQLTIARILADLKARVDVKESTESAEVLQVLQSTVASQGVLTSVDDDYRWATDFFGTLDLDRDFEIVTKRCRFVLQFLLHLVNAAVTTVNKLNEQALLKQCTDEENPDGLSYEEELKIFNDTIESAMSSFSKPVLDGDVTCINPDPEIHSPVGTGTHRHPRRRAGHPCNSSLSLFLTAPGPLDTLRLVLDDCLVLSDAEIAKAEAAAVKEPEEYWEFRLEDKKSAPSTPGECSGVMERDDEVVDEVDFVEAAQPSSPETTPLLARRRGILLPGAEFPEESEEIPVSRDGDSVESEPEDTEASTMNNAKSHIVCEYDRVIRPLQILRALAHATLYAGKPEDITLPNSLIDEDEVVDMLRSQLSAVTAGSSSPQISLEERLNTIVYGGEISSDHYAPLFVPVSDLPLSITAQYLPGLESNSMFTQYFGDCASSSSSTESEDMIVLPVPRSNEESSDLVYVPHAIVAEQTRATLAAVHSYRPLQAASISEVARSTELVSSPVQDKDLSTPRISIKRPREGSFIEDAPQLVPPSTRTSSDRFVETLSRLTEEDVKRLSARALLDKYTFGFGTFLRRNEYILLSDGSLHAEEASSDANDHNKFDFVKRQVDFVAKGMSPIRLVDSYSGATSLRLRSGVQLTYHLNSIEPQTASISLIFRGGRLIEGPFGQKFVMNSTSNGHTFSKYLYPNPKSQNLFPAGGSAQTADMAFKNGLTSFALLYLSETGSDTLSSNDIELLAGLWNISLSLRHLDESLELSVGFTIPNSKDKTPSQMESIATYNSTKKSPGESKFMDLLVPAPSLTLERALQFLYLFVHRAGWSKASFIRSKSDFITASTRDTSSVEEAAGDALYASAMAGLDGLTRCTRRQRTAVRRTDAEKAYEALARTDLLGHAQMLVVGDLRPLEVERLVAKYFSSPLGPKVDKTPVLSSENSSEVLKSQDLQIVVPDAFKNNFLPLYPLQLHRFGDPFTFPRFSSRGSLARSLFPRFYTCSDSKMKNSSFLKGIALSGAVLRLQSQHDSSTNINTASLTVKDKVRKVKLTFLIPGISQSLELPPEDLVRLDKLFDNTTRRYHGDATEQRSIPLVSSNSSRSSGYDTVDKVSNFNKSSIPESDSLELTAPSAPLADVAAPSADSATASMQLMPHRHPLFVYRMYHMILSVLNARLYRVLRDQLGLCYAASAAPYTPKYATNGFIELSAAPRDGMAVETARNLLLIVENLFSGKDAITAQELEEARRPIMADLPSAVLSSEYWLIGLKGLHCHSGSDGMGYPIRSFRQKKSFWRSIGLVCLNSVLSVVSRAIRIDPCDFIRKSSLTYLGTPIRDAIVIPSKVPSLQYKHKLLPVSCSSSYFLDHVDASSEEIEVETFPISCHLVVAVSGDACLGIGYDVCPTITDKDGVAIVEKTDQERSVESLESELSEGNQEFFPHMWKAFAVDVFSKSV